MGVLCFVFQLDSNERELQYGVCSWIRNLLLTYLPGLYGGYQTPNMLYR